MALVASSTPHAGLWAKATQPVGKDEKRPAERPGGTPSPPSSSSRRTSSGSDTFNSSGNSFNTQQSGESSQSTTKPKQHNRRKGPDIVLHVEDCAFAIHSRILKRKCHVLYRFIAQLRGQNAVGHLANDECEAFDGDGSRVSTRDQQFALRQRNPLSNPRHGGSSTQPHGQCPVTPRHQLSGRASQSSSPRSPKYSKVRCVAHQRPMDEIHHDSEEQQQRLAPPRQHMEVFSPGKENYVGALATSSTVRMQTSISRGVLAPKLPSLSSSTSTSKPSRRSSVGPSRLTTNLSASNTPSPPQSGSPQRDVNPFDVELIGATPDAAATFIEFLYSGRTSGIDEGNAAIITSLCKWFCMEDHLLYAALICRANSLNSVDQWMDILLCCTNLRSPSRRTIVIDFLLKRLVKLTPAQYKNAMNEMPLHRLSAIEDPDVFTRVLTSMINNLRSIEIWCKLTFALELWLFWSFRRRFTVPVPLDHAHPVTIRQPLSLQDFHEKYVSWNPVIRLTDKEISGSMAYVSATTLFTFGSFAFQVRYGSKEQPLISWRVVRMGTPSDTDDNVEQCEFRPGLEPSFVVRGQLAIVYKCTSTNPLLQEFVFIKYTHSEKYYAKWHPLVTSPSSRAKEVVVATAEPESEEKTQDPSSSQEESTPYYNDSDTEIDARRLESPGVLTTPPSSPVHPQHDSSGSGDGSELEMKAHFSGQFFVWGDRLCNLYHYLLMSTLFYQVPRHAPREMLHEAVQARMRELPFETLELVLQSDRLCVPQGETTLAIAVATLCLTDYGTVHYSIEQICKLFQCVRWCFVDLEQIMVTLEHSRRELQLYELIEQQLRDSFNYGTIGRLPPWGVDEDATPYRVSTTLVEFQIEAGDRSLSPSKFMSSQG